MKLDNLMLTLKWVKDISEGEMITRRNYTKTHLGFDKITQTELSEITENVNNILLSTDLSKRLYLINYMGEIIPVWLERKHHAIC